MLMHGVIALALLASQPNAKAVSREAVAATWHAEEMGASCTETYASDGTFSGECSMGGQNPWKFGGTWTLEGDVLSSTYTRSSSPAFTVGKVDHDRVAAVSVTELTLIDEQGVKVSYRKLGGKPAPALPKAR